MNIPLQQNMHSKAVLAVLLFLLPLDNQASVTIKDTIIIDNTYLLVEREVVVDSTNFNDPKPELKRERDFIWRFGLVSTIGLTSSSLTSNSFQSVQEAANDPVLNGINYGVGLRVERALIERVFLFTEVGWDQSTCSNNIFDLDQIADGLFFFESFKQGELSQIIRNQFEIGGMQVIETDTAMLSISQQETKVSQLALPIGVRYQQPWFNQKSKWTFDIGFALAYYLNLTDVSPTQVWINDEQRPPTVLSTDDYNLRSNWIAGRLEFGAIHRITKKLQFTYRYLAETPVQVMDVPEGLEETEWRIWNNRLKVGVNILF